MCYSVTLPQRPAWLTTRKEGVVTTIFHISSETRSGDQISKASTDEYKAAEAEAITTRATRATTMAPIVRADWPPGYPVKGRLVHWAEPCDIVREN